MKFSFNWLKRHLDTDKSVFEVSEALTSLGIEVEGIENTFEYLKSFKVAEVKSVANHPYSDHLHICSVFNGKETFQIVTGASNVQKCGKYPLAEVGTLIPNGKYLIEPRKLRGVESIGMLCSADELFIPGNYPDGLLELSSSAKVGDTILNALNLHDYVIDVSLTPNRGDCFGIHGIARDLAAKGIGKLIPIKFNSLKSSHAFPLNFEYEDSVFDTCPIFSILSIKNIKNVESPDWLKNLLLSAGINPKNALVDITNFVNIDMARPLHAYDMNLIDGNDIFLKHANNGCKFKDLKGNESTLDDKMTVLCDKTSPMSIVGIIGGERTMCSLETTDIILESCYLTPNKIMQTGQKLNITSDARTRFERGIDYESVILGLKVAASLIVEICGGEVSEIVSMNSYKIPRKQINLQENDFEKLVGIKINLNEIKNVLQKLEFEVTEEKGTLNVTVPSFRSDISIKEDLIEEVLRLVGYNEIPEIPFFDLPLIKTKNQDEIKFENLINVKKLLSTLGYNETINYSFISSQDAETYFKNLKLVEIANPISNEMAFMRPSLLPNLINSMKKLLNYGENEVALSEVGSIFINEKNIQTEIAGLLTKKESSHNNWNDSSKIDVFKIKSHVLNVLKFLGVNIEKIKFDIEKIPSYMHKFRTTKIFLNDFELAMFGELNPFMLNKFGIKDRVFAFSVNYDNVINAEKIYQHSAKVFNQTKFQKIERDFAFIVDEKIPAGEMINLIKNSDKSIESIDVFDVYVGEKIGKNKKSIAITVSLDQGSKILTDQDITKISDKIINSVKSIGATLRDS